MGLGNEELDHIRISVMVKKVTGPLSPADGFIVLLLPR